MTNALIIGAAALIGGALPGCVIAAVLTIRDRRNK